MRHGLRIPIHAALLLLLVGVTIPFPRWHRFDVREKYSFRGMPVGTGVRLGLVLPRSGPYQRVTDIEISWTGAIERTVEPYVELIRLAGTADESGTAEAMIAFRTAIRCGRARWHDDVTDRDREPERFIESDHPEIVAAAMSLASGTTRDDAHRIFSFSADHVSWTEARPFVRDGQKKWGGGTESALETYRSRRGGCLEFSNLAVALSRARGIPARTIDGLAFPRMLPFSSQTAEWGHPAGAHAWMEFYTPRSWELADPSWASNSREPGRYFGHNDGLHLSYGEVRDAEEHYERLFGWATDGFRGVGGMSNPLRFAAATSARIAEFTPSASVTRRFDYEYALIPTGILLWIIIVATVEIRARRKRVAWSNSRSSGRHAPTGRGRAG